VVEPKVAEGLPSSEVVYRRLRRDIVSAALPPGSRLVELDIAADFGVSRTPVREALKRLIAEKLVLADPTRGVVVHDPGPREIEDVFVVREALDGLAARLAAHRVKPSDLARLRMIVDAMRQAAAEDRRDQIMAADHLFHDVIYEAAGNPILARVAGDLRDHVHRFSSLPLAGPERAEQVLAEHEAIVAALDARDADAADAASNRHLAAAREYLVRLELESFAMSGLG
jgi:DNA-binding GntR family transcriptional regulator